MGDNLIMKRESTRQTQLKDMLQNNWGTILVKETWRDLIRHTRPTACGPRLDPFALKDIHWDRWGFPGSSDGEEAAYNEEDLGLIPELGRSGEGNGNPLQYSCSENSLDRGGWWATVHGFTKSQIWLSHVFIETNSPWNLMMFLGE